MTHRKTSRFTGRGPATRRHPSMAALQVEGLEARRLLSAATHLRHHWHTGFHVTPSATPDFVITKTSSKGTASPNGASGPYGLTPAAVRHAYGVDATTFRSIAGDGSGQTIAIVDAYNDPGIAADLATFDNQFGLPAATLTVENQNGSTTSLPGTDPAGPGDSWAIEISLDVEWAHAVAPAAKILLVEANSPSDSDLFTAVDTARKAAGVSVVSMSFGGTEFSSETGQDSHFTTPSGHQGVTFVASTGDSGAYVSNNTMGVEYPAASKNVLAVGGTTLTIDSNNNYVSETGWGNGTSSYKNGGAGGGISKYVSQPTYQNGTVTQSTTKRTVPDVAFDADPNSGVAVVDSYDEGASSPWVQVGGTSLAAPMWAGVIAMVNQGRVINGLTTLDGPSGTLPAVYGLPASDFHDVTTGNNGYAAGAGYDLVTGRGTPIVNLLAPALSGGPAVAPLPSYLTASTGAAYTYNPTAGTISVTGGTLTFTADEASNPSLYGAPLSVTASGGASLVFQTNEQLGSLTLTDATATLAASTATQLTLTGPLTLTGAGTLDLGAAGNLVAPTTASLASYVSQAAGPVQSNGLNAWTGNGLTSSVVRADAANGNAKELAVGSFDSRDDAQTGLSVPTGDTLVKVTVYGDATGDGKVTIADLSIWNNGFGVAGPRWSEGDFNFDGKVDIADLSIWNNDFGNTVS